MKIERVAKIDESNAARIQKYAANGREWLRMAAAARLRDIAQNSGTREGAVIVLGRLIMLSEYRAAWSLAR